MRARARIAVERRAQGAPFAYAVGRASFRHLTLDVDERVLIPRAGDGAARRPRARGAGAGARRRGGRRRNGIGRDRAGARRPKVASPASTGPTCRSTRSPSRARTSASARRSLRAPVDLVHGSLLGPLRDVRCRVVVSNPPYIALGEAEALPASVRDWEPAVALFSGGDGLAATARLVRQAADGARARRLVRHRSGRAPRVAGRGARGERAALSCCSS